MGGSASSPATAPPRAAGAANSGQRPATDATGARSPGSRAASTAAMGSSGGSARGVADVAAAPPAASGAPVGDGGFREQHAHDPRWPRFADAPTRGSPRAAPAPVAVGDRGAFAHKKRDARSVGADLPGVASVPPPAPLTNTLTKKDVYKTTAKSEADADGNLGRFVKPFFDIKFAERGPPIQSGPFEGYRVSTLVLGSLVMLGAVGTIVRTRRGLGTGAAAAGKRVLSDAERAEVEPLVDRLRLLRQRARAYEDYKSGVGLKLPLPEDAGAPASPYAGAPLDFPAAHARVAHKAAVRAWGAARSPGGDGER